MTPELNPARTIELATAALDFETPLEAGDPRWEDLTAARGDNATARLKRLFERQPKGDPLHVVFASHRGAGKSTELKRFAHEVKHRYFCVYLEANVEMDANEFSMEDLQLVLARAVEQQMRDAGLTIPADRLAQVEKWFAETIITRTLGEKYVAEINTAAKAKGGIPIIAELMASLTALFRVESEHREQVKAELRKYPGTLTDSVNRFFQAANERLREHGQQLLVILDNMDRYPPALIDKLLIQEVDRFRRLECNLVLTPPISLLLKPETYSIDSMFKAEVMPTARLRTKQQGYREFSGPGRDVLLHALARRIDLDVILPDAAARDRLIAASGGAIRELLEMTQEATLEVDQAPISLAEVNRVLDRRRNKMRDKIDQNDWMETLAVIASTKRLTSDAKFQEVMFQRLAFHYNGEIWYDVHPLVADIPEFQGVLARFEAEGGRIA